MSKVCGKQLNEIVFERLKLIFGICNLIIIIVIELTENCALLNVPLIHLLLFLTW